MAKADESQECPFCKESIRAGAVKCRYCQSDLSPSQRLQPRHGGTCPFCQEAINPEATVCPHCRSLVLGAATAPDHGGTCPFCKEQINAQAKVCKHCGSNLLDDPSERLTARLDTVPGGGGGLGYDQECMTKCQNDCVRSGQKADACFDKCLLHGGCSGTGTIMLGGGSVGTVPTDLEGQLARRVSAGQVGSGAGGGCGGCGGGCGGRAAEQTDTSGLLRRPIRWVTECHNETGWICTSSGCVPTVIRVCITRPVPAIVDPPAKPL